MKITSRCDVRMILYLVVALAAVGGCTGKNPTTTFVIHSTEQNRQTVIELVTDFAESNGLSKTVDYDTLDESRDAVLVSYRSSTDEILMVLHGIMSDGSITLHFYDGESINRDEFIAKVLPAIRGIAISVKLVNNEG